MHQQFAIEVKTAWAIGKVKQNLENHIEEFEQQMIGWKNAMDKYSTDLNKFAQNGGDGARPQEPHQPDNYSDSYHKLLDVLGAHVGETLTLFESQINNIVHNKFGWSGTFATNSTLYNG